MIDGFFLDKNPSSGLFSFPHHVSLKGKQAAFTKSLVTKPINKNIRRTNAFRAHIKVLSGFLFA